MLASTAPGLPIVWDEGEFLWRSDQALAWLRLLPNTSDPEGGLRAFSEPVITKYWKFVTWDEGLGSAEWHVTPANPPLPFALRKRLDVFGHNAPLMSLIDGTGDWSFALSAHSGTYVDLDGSHPDVIVFHAGTKRTDGGGFAALVALDA